MAWMKKMMSAEEERTLAKDLAIYYAHKGKQELALQWFDEFMSLETDQPIATVLYRRAQTKRSLAQPENALVDALRASSIKKRNPDMAMAVVDCMKELNQFENCAIKLNDNIKRFKGNTKERFELGLSVLHENFEDTVGDAYLPFILCNEHALMEAWRENEKNKIVDSRPLWKAQRDKGLCDVMSVIEKEELLLPPVEVARRARAFCVFSQTYVQRSWFEVQFLRQLQRHHALNCKQWKESTPNLLRVVDHTNKEIRAVMSMLHARSPLYNVNYRKYPNKKKFLENLEKTLNHVQYQTRRTMHNALRTIKELQRTEQIDKLGEFIETIMGDYVVVKTSRIMPWKFEFLNEVYNQLALSYMKQYTNSLALFCNKFRTETTEKDKSTDKKNLRLLFILPKEDQMQRPALQFGDKTAYREENINKRNQIAYKKMVDRMEKRLVFAKHEIERAYILHQIGKMHLRFNHYDKCCEVSQKGAKEAKLCNSFIWQILCLMLSCKAQICLQKLEILKDTLTESYVLAELLKSPKMCVFIETCLNLTSELMQSRKSKNRQGSEFAKRPKRSYFSMHSSPSDASIH